MQVSNGKSGTKTIKVYGCSYHRNRGDAVCTNTTRRPVDTVDDAVVSWIETNVLTEQLVLATVAEVRQRVATRLQRSSEDVPRLAAEAREIEKEIARLNRAIAMSDDPPESTVMEIQRRQTALSGLRSQIEHAAAAPKLVEVELSGLEAEARKRLAGLRDLLRRQPEKGRQAIEALLDGPLTFKPIGEGRGNRRYRIEGPISLGTLFTTEGDPNGI